MNGMKTYIEYIKNILREVNGYEHISVTDSIDMTSLYLIVKDIDMLMQISSYITTKEYRFIKSEDYLSKNILSNLETVLMCDVDKNKVGDIKRHCGILLDESYKINSDSFKIDFLSEEKNDYIYISYLSKSLIDDELDICDNDFKERKQIYNIDEKMASTIKTITNKLNLINNKK
ncbi:TPA: hypothetical protein KPJ62_002653 [Clostridioides difficile]|nr:hypothetical protein [Clostridioides difficile]